MIWVGTRMSENDKNAKSGFSSFVLVRPEFIPQQKKLSYDLYIQTQDTKRLLLYRRQGLPFDGDAIEELTRMNARVYISEKEWTKVLTQKGSVMATLLEKGAPQEKIAEAAGETVRRLSEIQPGESVNQVMRDCSQVVEQTVESFKGTKLSQTFKQLDEILVKQDDPFLTHSRNVSTMAVLFGMIVGIQDSREVVDLGVAGFLHDAGFVGLDKKVIELYFDGEREDLGLMSQDYLEHPENSVKLSIAKGIPLSLRSKQAILEHHERVDGEGFPYGLAGEQISLHARVLAIADHFVGELQANSGGKADPAQILKKLISENTGAQGALDPELLAKIQDTSFSVEPTAEASDTKKKAA